jgi:hypothetical protein
MFVGYRFRERRRVRAQRRELTVQVGEYLLGEADVPTCRSRPCPSYTPSRSDPTVPAGRPPPAVQPLRSNP